MKMRADTDLKKLTNTRDSISRVSSMARAKERPFGIGAVSISVAIVCSRGTFVNIYRRMNKDKFFFAKVYVAAKIIFSQGTSHGYFPAIFIPGI